MEEEAKVPVPTLFHRTVVNWPGCVLLFTGLIAIVLAVMAFGAGESELGGSFTDVSNLKVRRLYGFFAFRQDYWKATDKDWRRRLSSDFGRTRSPSISKAALARISDEVCMFPLWSYNTWYAFSKDVDFTPTSDEIPRFFTAKWN